MPKIPVEDIPIKQACIYPAPYDQACAGRTKCALGDVVGLTQFGVNLTTLAPGSASAHRHWHANEDEFIYIVSGQATLIEDDAEILLRRGDCAGFKAGIANGHHLVNQSDQPCIILEVGTRTADEVVTYTDTNVDMHLIKTNSTSWNVKRKDGSDF